MPMQEINTNERCPYDCIWKNERKQTKKNTYMIHAIARDKLNWEMP